MTPAGYMYKKVAFRPDWLHTNSVIDFYSLSGCSSKYFTDYIELWKHNGYWLFNSPEEMNEIARNRNLLLVKLTPFYYEVYEYEFDEDTEKWNFFVPEESLVTNVKIPTEKHLEGFDVTTFTAHSCPECSPLSCNSLAETIPVNKHCLFDTFVEAKKALDDGLFANCEPGPFRIFAVYTVG